jgi:hypothetical protein
VVLRSWKINIVLPILATPKLERYYSRVYTNCKRQNRGSIYKVRDIGKDKLKIPLKEELVKHRLKRGYIT